MVPKRPPDGAILHLVFCYFPTVHFCIFATHVLWQFRLCVSPKVLFFLVFFHYFHLHASWSFFLFGCLLPSPFASILGPRSGPNRVPNWCTKKTQIWFAFGFHFGSILAPFWVHFGTQNRTQNCVDFTSTFRHLSGALLGLWGVHFGSPRSPLWALWSPHWPLWEPLDAPRELILDPVGSFQYFWLFLLQFCLFQALLEPLRALQELICDLWKRSWRYFATEFVLHDGRSILRAGIACRLCTNMYIPPMP